MFDKIIAKCGRFNYNNNRTNVLLWSAKTCAVVVRTSVLRKRHFISRVIYGYGTTCGGDIIPFPLQEIILFMEVKLMQEIPIHCKLCGKSLYEAYTPTGNKDTRVLQGITKTCPHCHKKNPRAISLHNFTEEMFLSKVKNGKFYM